MTEKRNTAASPSSHEPGKHQNSRNEERFLSEGRIRVETPLPVNSSGAWFKPGNGKTEWFRDTEEGPEMVVVPSGNFVMGSSAEDIGALSTAYPNGTTGVYPDDTDWWQTEGPQRTVTISSPFAVARHAVTRGQFAEFVSDTGHQAKPGAYVWNGEAFGRDPAVTWSAPAFDQCDDHPVVCINWHDARAYAAWLSNKSGKPYRLPSEAEREYVARAGSVTPFWWGVSISTADANYNGNHTFGGGPKGCYRGKTAPVHSFAANPWGLFQVHGNVWEWCADLWNNSYRDAPIDETARTTAHTEIDAVRRVIRGGSWVLSPQLLRSANRLFNPADERSHDLGFRLVRGL